MSASFVVGKFYPFHRGHLELIKFAKSHRSKVFIGVYGNSTDSIPISSRSRWISSELNQLGWSSKDFEVVTGVDATPYDLDSETVWASHIEIFRSVVRKFPEIDLLVSSESYGDRLANELHLKHKIFDISRSGNSVSGTLLRDDLSSSWDELPSSVKSDLTIRAVFLGAESTGTSTISKLVADRFRSKGGVFSKTQLVLEYGREVTEQKLREFDDSRISADWSPDDFVRIAFEQNRREEEACVQGGPILVCDTDALTTTIWEKRYLGSAAELNPSHFGKGHIYFVTHHDGVPFIQDGTRDGENVRESMTHDFIETILDLQKPIVILTGDIEERVNLAVRTIEEIRNRLHSFTDPY